MKHSGSKNFKAFTLIELLVVVAIIGILAAVGVVAYNGYTASAKKAVIKDNHKAFSKKAALVVQDCDINGSVSLMKNSPSGTKLDTSIHTVNCYSPNKSVFWGEYFRYDMMNSGFKNIEKSDPIQAISISSTPLDCWYSKDETFFGSVIIKGHNSMDHVSVCTCIEKPCSSDSNRLEVKILY